MDTRRDHIYLFLVNNNHHLAGVKTLQRIRSSLYNSLLKTNEIMFRFENDSWANVKVFISESEWSHVKVGSRGPGDLIIKI